MWYITRDQSHWNRATTILDARGTTITGIGGRDEPLLLGLQSQGTDLYSEHEHILMRAAEYTAKYNLGYDVPYDRTFAQCTAQLVNGPWTAPSNIHPASEAGVVNVSKSFDIVYYQYAVKRGMDMPYTAEMNKKLDAIGGEGQVSKNPHDHPGWGDLIWSYPGKGDFLNDDSRTIWGGGFLGPDGAGFFQLTMAQHKIEADPGVLLPGHDH